MMLRKPQRASDYTPEQLSRVKETCLFIATCLGDFRDDFVIVGGLVPTLLIESNTLPEETQIHPGTMDLDIGLSVALLDTKRYRTFSEALRQAGFKQSESEKGNPTLQKWEIQSEEKITVDFLIPPSRPGDRSSDMRHIESDFGAIIAPGLHMAFLDRQQVTLSGKTIRGEWAKRDIWVCGPGAFIILKALAFNIRGEPKDAYDLFYVAKYYGSGIKNVATRMRPLLKDNIASDAFSILQRDFLIHDAIGPRRAADFISGQPDDYLQADVVGTVSALLQACDIDTSDNP